MPSSSSTLMKIFGRSPGHLYCVTLTSLTKWRDTQRAFRFEITAYSTFMAGNEFAGRQSRLLRRTLCDVLHHGHCLTLVAVSEFGQGKGGVGRRTNGRNRGDLRICGYPKFGVENLTEREMETAVYAYRPSADLPRQDETTLLRPTGRSRDSG